MDYRAIKRADAVKTGSGMEVVAEDGLGRRLAPLEAALGKGHAIALADGQIAATALACGLTLVSNDGDLRRVPGLQVVDWRAVR